MSSLTQRQRAIYDFIVGQIQLQGLPPTLMEIADAFGLSSAAGIADHLNAIERKGYIRRRRGVSRGIELPHRRRVGRRASVRVPVLGLVPSSTGLGRRDEAGSIFVDGRAVGSRAFAVRADEALRDMGVLAGDYLLVDSDLEPGRGDLVLGRQGDRTLLLRLSSRNRATAVAGRLSLGENLEILGAVAGVFRSANGLEEQVAKPARGRS